MAIIENKTYIVKDSLWLRSTIPLTGILSLTGFVDDTTGEDSDYFYVKSFRYSKNGLPFVEWNSLTTQNLSSLIFESEDIVFFEFQYTHSSSLEAPSSHEMSLESVTLTGELNQVFFGTSYEKSIFGEIFPSADSRTLTWTFSLSEKLYEKGIVPSFLERDIDSDDYISFWKSVSMFFSQIVVFAREIGRFEIDIDLMKNLLLQRNLFFCEEKVSLVRLRLLTDNFYKEVNKRGTWEIINKENVYGDVPIEGELLRLICWTSLEEFIFNLTQSKKCGWCVGESSPLFTSIRSQRTLNKNYESNGGFFDKSKYPLINESLCSLEGEDFLIEGVVEDQISGIGYQPSVSGKISFEKAIIVNPWISYEISFWVKQTAVEVYFTFGAHSYDRIGREVKLLSMKDGSFSNLFFQQKDLNIEDEWYYVSGIIHGLYTELDDKELNIGFGNHLRFFGEQTKFITPYIVTDMVGRRSIQNRMLIRDLQIKPTRTPFSTGWLNKSNFIEIWMKSSNKKFSPEVRESIIYVKSAYDKGVDVLKIKTVWNWGNCFIGDFLLENSFIENSTKITYTWKENGEVIIDGVQNPSFGEEALPSEWDYYIRLSKNPLQNLTTWTPVTVSHLIGYYDLERIMKRYLLPYNSSFKNIYLQWDI